MGIVDKLVIDVVTYISENASLNWMGLLILCASLIASFFYFTRKCDKNPFSKRCVRERRPVELDVSKRDAILKQVSIRLMTLFLVS